MRILILIISMVFYTNVLAAKKKKNCCKIRRSTYVPRGYRTSFIGKSYPNYAAILQAKNEIRSRVERL